MTPIFDEIRAADLERWADDKESEQWHASLMRQLVLTSGAKLRACRFLTHEQTNLGGWDGITDAAAEGLNVSEGISVWELSKQKYVVGKANRDFAVRLKQPGDIDQAKSTYVVVTLRQWPGRRIGGKRLTSAEHKANWEKEQQTKSGWRRVRVLDATDIASMLAQSPGVSIWLAEVMGRNVRGARSLVSQWRDLATLRSGLRPATFLAGRQTFSAALEKWITGTPSPFEAGTYSSDDLRDALAAWWAIRTADEPLSELSPVAVNSAEAWTYLTRTTSPLLLLADEGLELTPEQISAATARGHFVIHRTSAIRSGGTGWPLPPLYRDMLSEELVKGGMTPEEAWRIAGDVAGSGTALKRILGGHSAEPAWAHSPNALALAPVVLLGAWDSGHPSDRERVEAIFQHNYDEVERLLRPWAETNDPLVRFAEYSHSVKKNNEWVTSTERRWRVVTREDAWRWLFHHLTRDDFERFRIAAVSVLTEPNPRYDMPADKRICASVQGAVPKHSHRFRRAMGETLCLLSLRSIQSGEGIEPAAIARQVASDVFANAADWRLWASLNYSIVFLAEAAPDIFLKAIEEDLKRDPPATVSLFEESGDSLFGDHPHVELMWALQALLWEKATVMRVLSILTSLAARDPGGNTSPRPLGILRDAFLPWLPQCCLDVEERCRALNKIMAANADVGWKLFFVLLPKTHDVSSPITRPSYRAKTAVADQPISDADYWRQVEHVANGLVAAAGSDLKRWKELLEEIHVLPTNVFDAAIVGVRNLAANISNEERGFLWEALRRKAAEHRYFANADWAMPEADLVKIEATAAALEPAETVLKNAWLFSRRGCFLSGTTSETPHEVQESLREESRVSAIREIFANGGIAAVRELVIRISEVEAGQAGFLSEKFDIIDADTELFPAWLAAEEKPIAAFARGYASSRLQRRGWQWLLSLQPDRWEPDVFGGLAGIFPFQASSWNQIDAIGPNHVDAYWRRTGSWMGDSTSADADRALNAFIQRGRPFAALECIHSAVHWKRAISPETSIHVLEAVRSHLITTADPGHEEKNGDKLDSYTLGQVFETLQRSDSLTPEQVTKVEELEWFFLPLLKHHGRPRLLLQRLRREPKFFVEQLEASSYPEDLPEEKRQSLDDHRANIATSARQLLGQNKRLPGSGQNGSFDESEFSSWITSARNIAAQKGYRKICEYRLGEMLLHSPVDTAGFWPCAAVCRLLSENSSDEMNRGFTCAIFNNQGWPGPLGKRRIMSSQGARHQALQELTHFAEKLNLEFPVVAELLRHAAKEQEAIEKRMFRADD